MALGSTCVACNGLLIGLVPFFSEKISWVSGRVTFFLVKRSHLLVFPLAFIDSFIERSRETRERGTKAPLHTPPWAHASAKPFQSHCYAWLFNQKTGSWASACRDHLKSITMLFFCYVITAVNWQQKHFSDISRTVNLLVIDFFERIVGYYNVWRPVLSGHIKHNTYLLGFFLSSELWRLVVP